MLRIRQFIGWALAAAALLIAMGLAIGARSIASRQQVHRAATYRLLQQLKASTSSLRSTEADQRAYLLSGSDKALQDYELGIRQTRDAYANLSERLAGAPEDRPELLRLAEARLLALDEAVSLYRLGHRAEAVALATRPEDAEATDRLASLQQRLETQARSRLLAEDAEALAVNDRAQALAILLSLAALVLLVTAAVSWQRVRRLETRQAEDALAIATRRLTHALEAANDGLWDWNVATGEAYYSPRFERMLGFDSGTLRPHIDAWSELVHPDDLPAVKTAIKEHQEGRRPSYEAEYRIRTASGAYRWMLARGKVVALDPEGGALRMVGTHTDMQERRGLLEELRRQVAVMAQAERIARMGAWTVDLCTGMGVWSEGECRNMGFPLGTTPTREQFLDRIHPDDRDRISATLQRIVESGRSEAYELRVCHPDGAIRHLLSSCEAVRDEEGQVSLLVGASVDLTDQKAAETERQVAAEERLSLLEAISVARAVPWSRQRDGGIRVGDSAQDVLGRDSAAFAANPGLLQEMLHPEDRHQLQHAHQEARRGRVGTFEARIRKGDDVVWTRWTVDEYQGLFRGVIQDITAQHELREQLLQSQKLESLGTLAGGIAHDFNNLLMAILGYVEVLEVAPALTPALKRGLEVIRRAATRGQGLVNQLMNFSRKNTPVRVLADLNALLKEAQGLIRHALPPHVELSMELDSDLPPTLLDPNQIHQVVMNLAINARDACSAVGHITIRSGQDTREAGEAQRKGGVAGVHLYFEVEDTGHGMPPEILARIFEPFFTTKGSGRGTGLGLSVVHGIVQAHQGTLSCTSQVGSGSTFRVLLPILGMEATEDGDPPPLGGHALRIVVLARPSPIRDAACSLLAQLGHKPFPVKAASDLAALQVHGPPDLVIVHVGMGAAASVPLALLRAGGQDPPILVAGDRTEDAPAMLPVLGRPARGLIRWPFRPSETFEALQKVLS